MLHIVFQDNKGVILILENAVVSLKFQAKRGRGCTRLFLTARITMRTYFAKDTFRKENDRFFFAKAAVWTSDSLFNCQNPKECYVHLDTACCTVYPRQCIYNSWRKSLCMRRMDEKSANIIIVIRQNLIAMDMNFLLKWMHYWFRLCINVHITYKKYKW